MTVSDVLAVAPQLCSLVRQAPKGPNWFTEMKFDCYRFLACREDPPRVFRAAQTEVSRKVVRKVLRSEATEFRYERSEQPLPRIGPWQDALDRMLATNEAKPSRERLTLIRLFEALRGVDYEGGYDAVRRYARVWQRDRAATSVGAFIPLSFAPGEAYQFDWSHEVVLINGTTVTVKVAHVRLCHSRMLSGDGFRRARLPPGLERALVGPDHQPELV